MDCSLGPSFPRTTTLVATSRPLEWFMGKRGKQPRPVLLRLLESVLLGDGCWEWQKSRMAWGYGRIRVEGRTVAAHRTMWEEWHGPILDGLFVCHRCDNPPCIRPDHLFLGTNADNLGDMSKKGRHVGMTGRRKAFCKHGHDDWVPWRNGTARRCAECHRIEERAGNRRRN